MDEIRDLIEKIKASGLFDAEWYLTEYPDVESLGIDPVEHYARWGRKLGRGHRAGSRYPLFSAGGRSDRCAPPNPIEARKNPGADDVAASAPARHSDRPGRAVAIECELLGRVDVVVPVYNALADVKVCLASVLGHDQDRLRELIVVNDGSDAETTAWLREFCKAAKCRLIEHDGNRGYTRAVNTGLRASRAEFVVTLNSDTVVTPEWLEGMVRCMLSAPDIGIVGPLSNAASWQNVPELYGPDKQFAINALLPGMSVEDMAAAVKAASARQYPRSTFLNGFCMMIRREVMEAVGLMDEERFPIGYGEENDLCVRAANAGFALAVADDTYVFHAKSKSFGHERRKELSARGRKMLDEKHGAERVKALIDQVKQTDALDTVRRRISDALRRDVVSLPESANDLRILFLLPVSGGSGGAHSVVQEAMGMRQLGVRVDVAVEPHRIASFRQQYEQVKGAADLFVECDEVTAPFLSSRFNVVVATIFTSVQMLKRIVEVDPRILPAYYVQDYEPFFFAEGTEHWAEARASYGLVPNAVLFAKTRWIADKVFQEHGVKVHKVLPSLDHSIYRPGVMPRDDRIHMVAMIRPQTPRRGAARTMRVLARLYREFGSRLKIHLFGVASDHPSFVDLTRDFEFESHGVLVREQVATLLARSHLFVDLSDYQAFGRTAIEAMACGCAVVVPAEGGADEFAVDGVNALVVDSLDEGECFRRIRSLLLQPETIANLASNGMATAASYSVKRAALSECVVLSEARAHFIERGQPEPLPELHLIPSTNDRGGFTFAAYSRLLCPYGSQAARSKWRVTARHHGEPLPVPGTPGAVALLQRDAAGIELPQIKEWFAAWRGSGGRVVYDIDEDLMDIDAMSARGVINAAQVADRARWLAEHADAITVSTDPLAQRMRPLNNSVTVVPDRLDRALWALDSDRQHNVGPYARQSDVVRIGYIGTPADYQDLQIVVPAMQRVLARYGKRVEVEVIGTFQHCKPIFGSRVGLPKGAHYPAYVRWLQQRVHWDIGIIPIADTPFNRCKSDIRFLEGAALDMALICSMALPNGVGRSGSDKAFVVENTEQSWHDAICRLVDDAKLRRRLAATARGHVVRSVAANSGWPKLPDPLSE